METELPQHFHMPIRVAQLISSKQAKDQYRQWIYNLHGAYTTLRANEDSMTRFEEELEAARQETLLQFEVELNTRCAEARATLARLRESFQSELRRAITDVCQHAVETWGPEADSLAGLMWHYDGASPLNLFHFWTGKTQERLSQAFQIVVETTFPAFLSFNGPMDTSTGAQTELANLSELAEARRHIKVLEGEKAALFARNRDLQNTYAKELSERTKASEAQIKEVAEEKEAIMREIAGKVKRLSKELSTVRRDNTGKKLTEETLRTENAAEGKADSTEQGALNQRLADAVDAENEIIPSRGTAGQNELETAETNPRRDEATARKRVNSVRAQAAPSHLAALSCNQLRFFLVESCKWSAPLCLDKVICCDSRSSYSVLDANRIVSCGSNDHADVRCTINSAPTQREAYLIHVGAGQCRVEELPLLNQQRWSPGLLPYNEVVFVFGCECQSGKSVERLDLSSPREWTLLPAEMTSWRFFFTPCLHEDRAYLCMERDSSIDLFDFESLCFLRPMAVTLPAEEFWGAVCVIADEQLTIITRTHITKLSLSEPHAHVTPVAKRDVSPASTPVTCGEHVYWINWKGNCMCADAVQTEEYRQ